MPRTAAAAAGLLSLRGKIERTGPDGHRGGWDEGLQKRIPEEGGERRGRSRRDGRRHGEGAATSAAPQSSPRAPSSSHMAAMTGSAGWRPQGRGNDASTLVVSAFPSMTPLRSPRCRRRRSLGSCDPCPVRSSPMNRSSRRHHVGNEVCIFSSGSSSCISNSSPATRVVGSSRKHPFQM